MAVTPKKGFFPQNKAFHWRKSGIYAQKSKLFDRLPNRLWEGENASFLYIVEAHNRSKPLKLSIQNPKKNRIRKS
jgi:hypothetical protein